MALAIDQFLLMKDQSFHEYGSIMMQLLSEVYSIYGDKNRIEESYVSM